MLYPRYQGSFVGRIPFQKTADGRHRTGSRIWGVTIYQEASAPWPSAPGLSFDADSPLTIEWDDVKPEDVIEGSTATLRLISPSFQYFADLYTVDPLGVTVEITAESTVIWRGSLEPELFEEPYATASGYTVELTFADFASMSREEFGLKGCQNLRTILSNAMGCTAIKSYNCVSSTKVNVTQALDLKNISISADNFYDEDGVAMNYREVVETVLAPFGLHMRQYGGVAQIYDWNGLCSGTPKAVDWTSTDASKAIAPIAHKVSVTYSTYADTTLAAGDIDTESLNPADATRSIAVRTDYNPDENVHGFSIHGYNTPSAEAIPSGLDIKGSPVYRIVSGHSGSDCAGVLALAKPSDSLNLGMGLGMTFSPTPGAPIMSLEGPWLFSPVATSYYIRISLNLLIDTRYNPYENDDKYNEKGNYDRLKNWANFGYIPVALELVGDNNTVLAHYKNSNVKNSNAVGGSGSWVSGAASPGEMWLAYYDASNRKSASGWGGWKKNRQCIGYWRDDLPAIYEKRGEGEYVPFPTNMGNGRLRLTVYGGADWFDYQRQSESSGHSLQSILRWALYGTPEMEIVRGDGTAIPTDDIIITGTAIEGAASDIDITLKAGSAVEAPTARAVLLVDSGDGRLTPASNGTFYRIRSGKVEELLLTTLISQYDSPHLLLQGEMAADIALTTGPSVWSEGDAPGRKFIPTAVALDAVAGTASATMREISPDNYTPIAK